MKILHLINSVNPADGGPIEGVKQLASVLTQNGHQVEVACLDSPQAPFLATFPIPVHALGPAWLKYRYGTRLVPWLRQHCQSYNVIVINGVWQYSSFGAWRALRRMDVPYVIFTHGMLDPWFKREYPLKHLKKSLYWPWGQYPVLRDARAVLFTCEEERLLARQAFVPYRCHEVVVNYGTAGPKGDPVEELAAFRQRYPELNGKRLAVFMGRIHPKKGCDLLIQGFAKVLAKDPRWHLVIAGPDQVGMQPKLHTMVQQLDIADNVTWTGMIGGKLKWGALRAAEIFVLPSHSENFGIVVAEALACGCPVLLSNKVNIWREIADSGAGIVADDTLEGTCSLFRSWVGLSPEQRLDMRKKARECFLRHFEITRAALSLASVLSGVSRKTNWEEKKCRC